MWLSAVLLLTIVLTFDSSWSLYIGPLWPTKYWKNTTPSTGRIQQLAYNTNHKQDATKYLLMVYLRDPELSLDNFRRQLKTFLFAQYWRWHPSTLETLVLVRSINLLFTLHYLHLQREHTGLSKSSTKLYTVSQKMHQLWNSIAQNYRFIGSILKKFGRNIQNALE